MVRCLCSVLMVVGVGGGGGGLLNHSLEETDSSDSWCLDQSGNVLV